MPTPVPRPAVVCPKCGGAVPDPKIHRILALAIYGCPCGTQFTVLLDRRPTAATAVER